MPLSETILIIMALLTVAMLAAGLCRELPVPFTVVLVVIGMALGEASRSWDFLAALTRFRLSPELVFFIFLPALIFESAFKLNARQLAKDLAPILMLAIPALLVSTVIIGLGISAVLGVPMVTAFLFGALISATDPVAVVALFKEIGAPLRMTVLVEGESLMNDATAIVLFGILLAMAAEGQELSAAAVGLAVIEFVRVFLGGALVGVLAGVASSELAFRMRSGVSAILTLTLVTAYASFIVAEDVLHVSGVMAAASAALALGIYGVTRMSRAATDAVGETWEFIALVANSLLFLLVGLSVDPAALLSGAGPIAVAVGLVLLARAATIYSLVPAATRWFALPRVTSGERHVMWWGGLKGGLAIAIVLSIPEDLPGRQLLIDLTLGAVMFTLLVNAPTIRPLMKRIGLDRLTEDERSELTHSLQRARHLTEDLLDRFESSRVLSRTTRHRIGRHLDASLESGDGAPSRSQAVRETYLVALSAEVGELQRLYELGLVSQYTFLQLRNMLQRDRDAHGAAGDAANASMAGNESWFPRVETAVLRRLREHDWASGLLARYQSTRLTQHLQHNIAGILMSRSALDALDTRAALAPEPRNALAAVYRERVERRTARVAAIRREFPEFYKSFESRLFETVALSRARQVAEHERHHGEIGAKAHTAIDRRIESALGGLPAIGESLPVPEPEDLIAMIPLLGGLSKSAIDAIAARARPVTFLEGDIVIGEGEKGDALYIIMHGEVAVSRNDDDGRPHEQARLHDGDFFGEMALLGDHVRTASVVATVPSTLLRLGRRDILSLARNNPEVAARLERVRQARA